LKPHTIGIRDPQLLIVDFSIRYKMTAISGA